MAIVIENYVAGQVVPRKWGSKKFEHKNKVKSDRKKSRQNKKKGRK